MKVKLLEHVHLTWLPAGTIGTEFKDNEGFRRFIPDNPVKGYGISSDGAFIGEKKTEEIKK